MYNDDVQWLSQTIFSHRDKAYGSNGYMRASMSTSTKDSQSFTAPSFVINIQNDGLQKTASLSYQMMFELYNRLKEVVQAAGQEYSTKKESPDAQLHFRTGKSAYLTFEFLRGSQEGEPVVRITISHGTSDSTKVLMPFSPEFHSFISLIGDMVGQRKYLDWCLHLPNRFFMVEMNEVIKQVPGLIKSAVVQIDSAKEYDPPKNSNDSFDEDSSVEQENVDQSVETMKELNAFMGEGMKNIELDIPVHMDTESKPVDKTTYEDSRLFKWIDGDIRNFENIVLRCGEKPNPIREVEKEIVENYCDMNCFPGATEQDIKSMIYLIGREYTVCNNMVNNSALKRTFSINKYKGYKHAEPINKELAYDLLTLNFFIRACREKIEAKSSDNYSNKAIMHMVSSLILSPFIFSFISNEDKINTVLVDRFRKMRDAGIFKSYEDNEYKTYGFEITDKDINDLCDAIVSAYFEANHYHGDSHMRHASLFGSSSCSLNPDNQLNEEQIINQVVPLEMYIMLKDIDPNDDREAVLTYANEHKIDQEILSLFIKTGPKKNVPIVKFFEKNQMEIPEENRKEFLDAISEYEEKDFDLSDNKFPYDSFGEDGVKALFLWRPESGEKIKTYKQLVRAIAESVHDKKSILSMITHNGETKKGNFSDFADYYSGLTGRT